MSKNYYVLAPDMPGFGTSDELNKKYSIDLLAHTLIPWFRKFVTKPYILFGASMGGMVSIKLLNQLTIKPTQLILYATPLAGDQLTKVGHEQLLNLFAKLLTTPLGQSKHFYKMLGTIINNSALMTQAYKYFYPSLSESDIKFELDLWRAQSPRVFCEIVHDIFTTSLLTLEKNDTPTLYIYSPRDNYISMTKVKSSISSILPKTLLHEINLDSHVPRGELNDKFFRSLYQNIKLEIIPLSK